MTPVNHLGGSPKEMLKVGALRGIETDLCPKIECRESSNKMLTWQGHHPKQRTLGESNICF